MLREQQLVQEFMYAAEQPIHHTPVENPSIELITQCFSLMHEEACELHKATNLISLADGLADTLYTIFWSANALGLIPFNQYRTLKAFNFSLVQTMNMTGKEINYRPLMIRSVPIVNRYKARIAQAVAGFATKGSLLRCSYLETGILECCEFANYLGLPIVECFHEVHRSNMTKFVDGHKDEQTGKWIKGPGYEPAQLEQILFERS